MDSRELKLTQEIRDSFGSILPFIGNKDTNISVDNNFIQIEVRNLGRWIHDEENSYDYEDDDQMIWARGEYYKYMSLFEEWAKKFDWYQFATLSLSTSEKNWCEFGIEIKLPPITAKLQSIPVELETESPPITLGNFWSNMDYFLNKLDASNCDENTIQYIKFAYEKIIQKGGATKENFDNLAKTISIIFSLNQTFTQIFDGYTENYRVALSSTLKGLSHEQKIDAVTKKLKGQNYLGFVWK
jgi:hypothetical protein